MYYTAPTISWRRADKDKIGRAFVVGIWSVLWWWTQALKILGNSEVELGTDYHLLSCRERLLKAFSEALLL